MWDNDRFLVGVWNLSCHLSSNWLVFSDSVSFISVGSFVLHMFGVISVCVVFWVLCFVCFHLLLNMRLIWDLLLNNGLNIFDLLLHNWLVNHLLSWCDSMVNDWIDHRYLWCDSMVNNWSNSSNRSNRSSISNISDWCSISNRARCSISDTSHWGDYVCAWYCVLTVEIYILIQHKKFLQQDGFYLQDILG